MGIQTNPSKLQSVTSVFTGTRLSAATKNSTILNCFHHYSSHQELPLAESSKFKNPCSTTKIGISGVTIVREQIFVGTKFTKLNSRKVFQNRQSAKLNSHKILQNRVTMKLNSHKIFQNLASTNLKLEILVMVFACFCFFFYF